MIFCRKNYKLKTEIAKVTASNKEFKDKCDYYLEKYDQLKIEQLKLDKMRKEFNFQFKNNFMYLSNKITKLGKLIEKLEGKGTSTRNDSIELLILQEEMTSLSKEFDRLFSFLEKHTVINFE